MTPEPFCSQKMESLKSIGNKEKGRIENPNRRKEL